MAIAKKKWGQHWLANDALAEMLVAAIHARPEETFIEIGPGTGRLTGALLRRGAEVVGVEVDAECCRGLQQRFAGTALTLICGDALRIDAELPWQTEHLRLIGNLPYNLSGPFLRWTASHRADIVDAHYMLQREVADRAASPPGSKSYGVLSVRTQWEFGVEVVKRLTAGSFRPVPKVDSAFVRLTPRPLAEAPPPSAHEIRTLEAGFAHRRKTLVNGLVHAGWEADAATHSCTQIGLRSGARAETVSPHQWRRLAAGLPLLPR
jgi:16S rRNA (adenine1518-N6/adenine1519-N6)-dimethyltransferase